VRSRSSRPRGACACRRAAALRALAPTRRARGATRPSRRCAPRTTPQPPAAGPDPFDGARIVVERVLRHAARLAAAASRGGPGAPDAAARLRAALGSLTEQLTALEGAVAAMEAAPARFGLPPATVRARRADVESLQARAAEVAAAGGSGGGGAGRAGADAPPRGGRDQGGKGGAGAGAAAPWAGKAGGGGGSGAGAAAAAAAAAGGGTAAAGADDDLEVYSQGQLQRHVMAEQDVMLGDIEMSVGR
jgi:hypothetical protein